MSGDTQRTGRAAQLTEGQLDMFAHDIRGNIEAALLALRNGNDVGQAKLALARAITDIETRLGDIDGDNIKAAWIRLKEMAAS